MAKTIINTQPNPNEIEILKKRIEDLEAQLADNRIKPNTTLGVAMSILNKHAVPSVLNEIDYLNELRKAKSDAEQMLEESADELGMEKGGARYNRKLRDIKRAKTIKEVEDIMNDVEVEVDLGKDLRTIMSTADEFGFGEFFARGVADGYMAIARRHIC